MSMKKIRRRLSQTFRFSIEGSLSELAEHLTIEDGGEVKENDVHVIGGFGEIARKLSLSHSHILDTSKREDKNAYLATISKQIGPINYLENLGRHDCLLYG